MATVSFTRAESNFLEHISKSELDTNKPISFYVGTDLYVEKSLLDRVIVWIQKFFGIDADSYDKTKVASQVDAVYQKFVMKALDMVDHPTKHQIVNPNYKTEILENLEKVTVKLNVLYKKLTGSGEGLKDFNEIFREERIKKIDEDLNELTQMLNQVNLIDADPNGPKMDYIFSVLKEDRQKNQEVEDFIAAETAAEKDLKELLALDAMMKKDLQLLTDWK